MRAGVNTSKKKLRKAMEAGCGPSPLCEPCGFIKKPVPMAWKWNMPGVQYPCPNEPNLGREVLLPGSNRPAVVVGCATPVGPSLLQYGRTSRRRECEGALVVRTALGIETVVTRSVVRERRRQVEKPGRATCKCAGLPYPHREGSDPLCERAGGGLGELLAQARDAYEGGEADERRLVASAAKVARGAKVETTDDATRVLNALSARQQRLYEEAEARRMEPKRKYKARIATAKRTARAEGWDV